MYTHLILLFCQEPSDIGYIGNILLTGLAGARISLLPRDEYEAAPDIMQYFADSLTSYSQELKYDFIIRTYMLTYII